MGDALTRRLLSRGMLAILVLCPLSKTRATAPPATIPMEARAISSFDSDWRFSKGDAAGAEQPGFDDASWRKLDLPHDWSIEGPFDKDNPTGAGSSRGSLDESSRS